LAYNSINEQPDTDLIWCLAIIVRVQLLKQNFCGYKFDNFRKVETIITRFLLIEETDFHQLGKEMRENK
jgi:hypothetical protein